MKHRTALILSAGVTAFVLVVMGGVAGLAAGEARGQASAPEKTPQATLAPEIQAQLQAREAEYQSMLTEANARLEQAYAKIDELQAQAPTQDAETQVYPISPDLAVGLVLNEYPGTTLLRWPELVDFQGTVAYEIVLDRGKVYLGATNGAILWTGVNTQTASSVSSRGGEHEDHEGEREHDDD
jgi:hypothetical protein